MISNSNTHLVFLLASAGTTVAILGVWGLVNLILGNKERNRFCNFLGVVAGIYMLVNLLGLFHPMAMIYYAVYNAYAPYNPTTPPGFTMVVNSIGEHAFKDAQGRMHQVDFGFLKQTYRDMWLEYENPTPTPQEIENMNWKTAQSLERPDA